MLGGGNDVLLRNFETVGFNTGTGLRDGGVAPPVYDHNDIVSVSENGIVTSLDDATNAFSIVHPSETPVESGRVWAIPDDDSKNRLGIIVII